MHTRHAYMHANSDVHLDRHVASGLKQHDCITVCICAHRHTRPDATSDRILTYQLEQHKFFL
jgi:hypothetical protein